MLKKIKQKVLYCFLAFIPNINSYVPVPSPRYTFGRKVTVKSRKSKQTLSELLYLKYIYMS